jgi:3-isopropylmalate/(R)-2-methylmalate dehydratase large subunit
MITAATASVGRSVLDKIWDQHVVAELDDETSLLHIDRVLLHERSGAVALRSMRDSDRELYDSSLVFGTMDHVIDTRPGRTDLTPIPSGEMFIRGFRDEAIARGVRLFDVGDADQGISHVTFPDLGIALPGTTIVCADSHTPTLGGIGGLAWGVGVTELEHALSTQTLIVKRPTTMLAKFDGVRPEGVYAKDLILALIATIGASGGRGHGIEFGGSAISTMSREGRMTLCNMAVECAAWTGIVAPDDALINDIQGRPFAPTGEIWERAVQAWLDLRSDPDAQYERIVEIPVDNLSPQVTWGTSPQFAVGVDERVPATGELTDPAAGERALEYMDLTPGQAMHDLPIDVAFLGSCTNARLSDLRVAANILRGRKVADGVRAICIPGSSSVRRAAEADGLDRVFTEAGFEWREAGCGFCFFAGGEGFPHGARTISSTNRNFEGRQGPGVRTHLASPATVAASALAGHIADPRELL